MEFEEECVCRTVSSCVIGCAVKMACLDSMTKGNSVLLGQIYPVNKVRLANKLDYCGYLSLLKENLIEIAK